MTSLAAATWVACASSPAPPQPPATAVPEATGAGAAAGDADTTPSEQPWQGDPDVPDDSPYADLRARIEQQRSAGEPAQDPLAPLRSGLERQAQQQIEAQRWDPTRPPAPQDSTSGSTPTDPALSQIAAEIAVDEELRRRADEQSRKVKTRRQVERELQEARFDMLEQAPLLGCVPTPRLLDEIPGDVVRHRRLQRDDFRALEMSDLPPGAIDDDIEPAYCPDGSRADEPSSSTWTSRPCALLDRDRSWWNEEGDHISEEWTLRHEQVHFDLAEVEARRLTREAGEVTKRLVGRGTTPEAAVVAVQQLWDAHFVQLRTDFLDTQLQYDRETRHGKNLSKQTEWFARAKRGL